MLTGGWQKVQRICHEALEHRPEARAQFLDDVCGPDSEIRREVESLLAVAEQAERFLESRTPETTSATMSSGQIGSFGSWGLWEAEAWARSTALMTANWAAMLR